MKITLIQRNITGRQIYNNAHTAELRNGQATFKLYRHYTTYRALQVRPLGWLSRLLCNVIHIEVSLTRQRGGHR